MELREILNNAHTDESMFRALYERTSPQVFRYILTRTRRRDESLDILERVYTSLWQSLKGFRYQSDDAFYAFLYTIVRRMIWRMNWGQRTTVELTDDYDIAAPEEMREDYRFLFAALATLPTKQRLVIELRYFSDFSFNEIAHALGITEGNAKVLHHRALAKLQTHIPHHE